MSDEVENILSACEARLRAGQPLTGSGFWQAVATVKRNPPLVEQYADRIAAIDRAAFERWAWLTFPMLMGDVMLWLGTLAGLGLVAGSYYAHEPWNGILLLLGTGVLVTTVHGLAHLIVGRVVGMRFTHWFIGKPTQPQPGVKVDYATYLRTPPRTRAWMHASGALATKVMPFLLLGAAWGAGVPAWTWIAMILLGVVQVISDLTLSVKKSDWKKFTREMGIARELEAR